MVLPDVSKVAREMTEMSQVMMLWRRWAVLGWKEKFLVIKNNVKNWRDLIKMDFATGVKLLAELEWLAGIRRAKILWLHQQMTDMALAVKNRKMVEKFYQLGRDYEVEIGLMTNNPAFLVKTMEDWNWREKIYIYSPTLPKTAGWRSWLEKSKICWKTELNTKKLKPIKGITGILEKYWEWSLDNPTIKASVGVAKEGAGEGRIPFAHLANSLPVYAIFADIINKNKNKNQLRVIDLGCGGGRNIAFVRQVAGKEDDQYIGVDYSQACITLANKWYGKTGVKFCSYRGKKLPFSDGSFDFLVSSHVLEHLKAKDGLFFLAEIARVLKKGGTAVIGTPNRKYCQDLLMLNPKEKRKWRLILPHLHEYYYNELKRILDKKHFFAKYRIDQTKNLWARRIMVESTEKLRPREGWRGLVYEIYSRLREISWIQDISARLGTEWILRKMKGKYHQLLIETELLVDRGKDSDGDNLVVVAVK